MILKEYQNELIIAVAAIFLLFGYSYKVKQEAKYHGQITKTQTSLKEIKHTAALKDIWDNKKTEDKLKRFKKLMPEDKTKFTEAGKKVMAKYSGLNASELNRLVTSIARLAVEISKLDITKVDKSYDVEFEYKW
jgi:hypothetical protein